MSAMDPSHRHGPITERGANDGAHPSSRRLQPAIDLAPIYATAFEHGAVEFNPPRDGRELLNPNLCFRMELVRPDGSRASAAQRSGMPMETKTVALLRLQYDRQLDGFWIVLRGEAANGAESLRYLLVPRIPDGNQFASLCFDPVQYQLLLDYRAAATRGGIDYETHAISGNRTPICAADLLNDWGKFQKNTPMPDGSLIDSRLSTGVIGSDVRFERLEPEVGGIGFWFKFSVVPEGGPHREVRWVLLTRSSETGNTVALQCDDTRKQLRCGYTEARATGKMTFDTPLPAETIVNGTGTLRAHTPMPHGAVLEEIRGIGLPQPAVKPLLHEIRYRPADDTYTLVISAEERAKVKGVSGERHTVEVELYDHSPSQVPKLRALSAADQAMIGWYEQARRDGIAYAQADGESFPSILQSGQLSSQFLLPDGSRLGTPQYIGFPKRSTATQLIEMRYQSDPARFHCTISGASLNGSQRRITLEILESGPLAERVRAIAHDREDHHLPAQFKRKIPALVTAGQSKHSLQPLDTELRPNTKRLLSFTKGEAFEQLVGVLLSSLGPTEKLTPQLCLRVDAEQGTFGTRVDYRLGKELFEVKWGGYEENIKATAAKHRALLEPGQPYRIVVAQRSETLDEPVLSFAELAMNSPLAPELLRTFVALEQMVARGEINSLLSLRDFLYGTVKQSQNLRGDARVESLRTALRQAYTSAPEKLPRTHYPNLEAYFEHEGKLYRSFISPVALSREEPERYIARYYFGELNFGSQLDRDIAVMLELATYQGRPIRMADLLRYAGGEVERPVFRLNGSPPLWISTHTSAGANQITSVEELKKLITFPEGNFEFGQAYIEYFGDRA